MLSLEQQILGQLKSEENKSIQESKEDGDHYVNEPTAGRHYAYLPDSTLDADTWVKAAEFVPGQQWQSIGK